MKELIKFVCRCSDEELLNSFEISFEIHFEKKKKKKDGQRSRTSTEVSQEVQSTQAPKKRKKAKTTRWWGLLWWGAWKLSRQARPLRRLAQRPGRAAGMGVSGTKICYSTRTGERCSSGSKRLLQHSCRQWQEQELEQR